MARPSRCRTIASFPDHWNFACQDQEEDQKKTILMSLEEYETIRLIDFENLTQEEAAQRMGVVRTSITATYKEARRKMAEFLVLGRDLQLAGGPYQVSEKNKDQVDLLREKRSGIMRLAVTHESGQIFGHFGKTEEFKIFDIQGAKVVDSKILSTNGQGHGALASFLKEAKVDTLICGGIGGGAIAALKEAGIKLLAGAEGPVDKAVEVFLAGLLPEGQGECCSDHGHGHGCGSHSSCGNHCGH